MALRDVLRRTPTIRQWLVLLLAAFIVPAAVAVATLSVFAYQRERAGIERANLDVARALMQAVDRELASGTAAMQALATSPNLDRADLRAFHGQATDVLHSRPGNVLLLLDDGLHQVVNTHVPFGAPLPMHAPSCATMAARWPRASCMRAPGRRRNSSAGWPRGRRRAAGTPGRDIGRTYLPPVLPLLPAGVAGLPSTLRRASAWALVSVLSIACSAVIDLP